MIQEGGAAGARVVVVGSVNLDLVVTAPTLPRPGETVLGRSFTTVPGGKGANQAVAAARAGAACAFVGAIGQDGFAQPLRDNLRAAGVDIARLRTVQGPSGVALITVDDAAENLIVVAPGANAALTHLDAPDLALVAGADVLLCQLEVPLAAVAQAASAAHAAGTTVVLNAAPARHLPTELLAAVDVLVVNQVEAAAIAGVEVERQADRDAEAKGEGEVESEHAGEREAGLQLALEPELDALLGALLRDVPRVVMTLGARGAAYADRDGMRIEVAAPRVEPVDTTAAGDAFTGALAVALAQRRPVVEALRWACAAGAACATRMGASSALPTRAEIGELYASAYGTRHAGTGHAGTGSQPGGTA